MSKWERGINAPDISVLNELSELLGVTTTELLNGERNNREISIESIKFYSNKSKMKYIKYFGMIIVLLLGVFSILFMFSNYNRFQVYSICSDSEEFVVNGYIVFNNEMNIIMIDKVEYIDKYIGTELELEVISVDIFLKYKNKVLFSSGAGNLNSYNVFSLKDYINNSSIYLNSFYKNEEYIKFDMSKLNQLSIEIVYINQKNQEKKIEIPLKILKRVSSTKIFY